MKETSWQKVHRWYDEAVGEEGHYYHRQIVLPGVLRLLQLKAGDRLLDAACGQGVLSRQLPQGVNYVGFDASSSLIQAAKKHNHNTHYQFLTADATQPLKFPARFSHAAIILALQNIREPQKALQHVAEQLLPQGKLVIVLNHPSFRIPRQSSWGEDVSKKIQYRRIDRYMTPLEIPIQTHPGKGGEETLSFHHPLASYIQWLQQAGCHLVGMEEWCSDKTSTGDKARQENRARAEFPLFLALIAER